LLDATEGNVISGNFRSGIRLQGGNSDLGSHAVAGNLIGVGVTGAAALPNQGDGIVIVTSRNNRIGTDADGTSDALEANVIAGNRNLGGNPAGPAEVANGVVILDSNTSDGLLADLNRVRGNVIGLDRTGTLDVGRASCSRTWGTTSWAGP
jgi:hypothetical protein